MSRCNWCNKIIWPWSQQSPGRTMHWRCRLVVERICQESDDQYRQQQYRLRWEEEDRL